VHAAMMDGGDTLRGRDALIEWIKQLRAAFSELVFTIQVGPIVQDERNSYFTTSVPLMYWWMSHR
jgi:hypothetical protein